MDETYVSAPSEPPLRTKIKPNKIEVLTIILEIGTFAPEK